MSKYIVITTVNSLTDGVIKFSKFPKWRTILVGDKKTPNIESINNITFLPIQEQDDLNFEFSKICPFNHYSRKNIGYLYAIMNDATLIADTDDDNIPYDYWGMIDIGVDLVVSPKIVNIYKLFTDKNIWPRGFPLSLLSDVSSIEIRENVNVKIGVYQGLVDCDPDVDAIYRLSNKDECIFNRRDNLIALSQSVYCPFNSQNTIWKQKTFPFLYLPCTVNFRFTDILRGYIAQRCIWEYNLHLGFTNSSAFQIRNEHNLYHDFLNEIPCYTQVESVIKILNKCSLVGNYEDDLLTIYSSLSDEGIVEKEELYCIELWLKDLQKWMKPK